LLEINKSVLEVMSKYGQLRYVDSHPI